MSRYIEYHDICSAIDNQQDGTGMTYEALAHAFEYDENGVGKITLECMDMLMGQLIAYKRCIQSRSFWDAKHCDGCMFYDDCQFDPREDEDEPQTENPCDGCVCDDGKHLMYCMNCKGIAWKTEPPKVEDEPQTEREGE